MSIHALVLRTVSAGGTALLLVFMMAVTAIAAEKRLHHNLRLSLDPEASQLEAVDQIDVNGHDTLALRLAPGLELKEALVNGESTSPVHDNGVLWIELPDKAAYQVTLTYGGRLEPQSGSSGLSPILAAEGGFLPYGIGWLASGRTDDDWATYDLTIEVPAPYKAIATGKMSGEIEENGRYRATFTADHRTEPPSVFAGNYLIDERDHKGLQLRTYFPADQQQLAATYLDQAARYLDLFERQIGDYPYAGFSMIAAPLPVGLGFPGLTYFSSQILRMPFMQTRSLAHEILHNWWANGVFIDQTEGNWAEGLTSYMADYALAEAEGQARAEEMRLGWLRDYAALPEARDKPLTAFRSKGHDADQVVGYNKVAFVLHMLKQEIGEEAFEKGLRRFWTSHRFEMAAWSDLVASFEAESGRDLSRFFQPWLTTKGAPRLTLDQVSLERSDAGFDVYIELSSDRDDYDLLVPVQIETEGALQEFHLRLRDGAASDVITTKDKPLAVGVDQQHDLFRHLADNEAPPIFRDVTLDQETRTIIAANGHQGAEAVAQQLAGRTLDTDVRLAEAGAPDADKVPLMVIGLVGDIEPVLAKIGVEAPPHPLKSDGSARSWVARRQDAPPVLVVEAKDEEALGALLRPLPHYSRYSFLTFEGRKVLEKGVWPSGENALTRRFD